MSANSGTPQKDQYFYLKVLAAPLFLAAVLGFVVLRKQGTKPRFLASPVPVAKAFWTDDGRVVGFSPTTTHANKTGTTHYLSWQREDGKLESSVAHTSNGAGIFPAPDGHHWARVERVSAKLQLLDTSKGFEQVAEFPLASDASNAHTLYWSSPEQFVAITNGSRKTASVWNTRTRSRLAGASAIASKSLPWLQTEIQAFRISPDRKMALVQQAKIKLPKDSSRFASDSITAGNRLSLISWPDCREIKRFDGDMYPTIGWSSDSKAAYAVAQLVGGEKLHQAEIVRFDIATGKTTRTEIKLTGNWKKASTEMLAEFSHAKFALGGRFLLMAGTDRKSARLSQKWHVVDTTTGKNCGEIRPEHQPKPWFGFWNGANFSPDGRYLLQPLSTGVEIWDMNRFVATSQNQRKLEKIGS